MRGALIGMADKKPALVLHLAGAPQPLHVALDAEEASTLTERLPGLMSSGEPVALSTADGTVFVVNFTHVATAHIESTRSDSNAYGAPSRGTGFSS